jgi:hypothetical protein
MESSFQSERCIRRGSLVVPLSLFAQLHNENRFRGGIEAGLYNLMRAADSIPGGLECAQRTIG